MNDLTFIFPFPFPLPRILYRMLLLPYWTSDENGKCYGMEVSWNYNILREEKKPSVAWEAFPRAGSTTFPLKAREPEAAAAALLSSSSSSSSSFKRSLSLFSLSRTARNPNNNSTPDWPTTPHRNLHRRPGRLWGHTPRPARRRNTPAAEDPADRTDIAVVVGRSTSRLAADRRNSPVEVLPGDHSMHHPEVAVTLDPHRRSTAAPGLCLRSSASLGCCCSIPRVGR